MKRTIKGIALLLTLVLICAGCGKSSPRSPMNTAWPRSPPSWTAWPSAMT